MLMEIDDGIKLQKILVRSSFLVTADDRRNSLEACGLAEFCELKLDQTSGKFVRDLFVQLLKIEVPYNKSNQLGLIVFLEYLHGADLSLYPEDKNFIKDVVDKLAKSVKKVAENLDGSPEQSKWEQQQKASIQKPQRNQINNLLAQGREESDTSISLQQTLKVDRSLIINYNLDKLMSAFRQKVGYEGAFVFAVAGEFVILEQYIIERIRRELKQKTGRKNERLEISLYRDSIATSADIKSKFLEKHQLECFTDLFKIQYNSDLVLIIWNHDIPPKIIKSLSQDFWTDTHSSVDPYLTGKSRCFVILWANLQGKRTLTGFPALPTPKRFDPDDLLPWFRGQLQILGIEEKRIEHYLKRLESQYGNLIGTYQEMNQIVSELQGSSKLYG